MIFRKTNLLTTTMLAATLILSFTLLYSGCGKKTPTIDFYCHYKADFVQKMNKNGEWKTIVEGTTWENCSAMRIETTMSSPGMPNPITFITISRPDLDVSWQLFKKSKKYIEHSLDETIDGRNVEAPPIDIRAAANYEELGKETVNGYDCVKYKATISVSEERSQEIFMWSAKELKDLVIKREFSMPDGSLYTWELSNIEIGEQPKDVFEIPADYTKATEAEMSTLMMKEMMGDSMPMIPMMPPMPPATE